MRPMNEIEIELPQIVLDRADAAYVQIRQQAAQEKQLTGKRFPRAAGILLAVVILSVTAVSATAAGIMGYRRYLAERMTDIGTEELGHLEMVAGQGSVQAEFNRELTKVMSACLDLDCTDEKYDILTLHGSWGRERQMERRSLMHGKQSVGSVRGESSHQEHPFIALLSENATQDTGEVYGMHFVYSGNFLAQAELSQFDSTDVACGTAEEIMQIPESITGQYLSGKKRIPVPETRRTPAGWIKVLGAQENNLKNIDVEIPLGVMTCVTGVSGSGKSSLVNEILYKHLARELNRARCIPGKHKGIEGVEQLDKVINIDQSPIGRTPRSNPATYTGVFDLIRDLFASTADAKAKGYSKGRFSFNVKGGRCEACGGDGIIKIEMHFLPDVYVPCEVCGGKRYNRETLDVKYKGKSIFDVLDMTVEEALPFFENVPYIRRKIETLYDVGLSYVKLGQPSTTLSGGEAQRIKLATELSRRSTGKTIYILDEPTTGLHFEDVHKLVEILHRLADGGNTVVVIEHNLDVIKTADYIIDMGPEGGDRGGTVIAKGTPEEIVKVKKSYTGYYVKKMLEKDKKLR